MIAWYLTAQFAIIEAVLRIMMSLCATNCLSVDGCATVAAGATTGGFTGGALLSAAIACVIAVVVLLRVKRRRTAKLE